VRKLVLTGLAPALLFLLAGCGGGGSGSVVTPSNAGSSSGGQASNSVAITVDSGPQGVDDADTPFITVTVCAPGSTSNCQTIDHVEVDTGSFGLRIISSVIAGTSLASALQAETSAGGNPVVECTQFADGFSWGPIEKADVQIAGESASDVPIQVMGDSRFESEIPTACSSTGTEEDTIGTFGANAILGIGPFADDCGSGCATSASNGWYYTCPANGTSTGSCAGITLAESEQTTDPAAYFQTDNNGVIVELASATEGASTSTGTLIFGIGTESNNSMTAKTLLTADSSYGDIGTTYTTMGGQEQFLPFSYFDTGSNAYYFADNSIPSGTACSGYQGYGSSNPASWFCPTSELNDLSATNTGQNGTESTVSFSIGNAYTLFNEYPSGQVFDDLGASSGSQPSDCASQSAASQDLSCAFDFGFPFFLGRNVYVAFAGANTSSGMGPYFAY
jgi:hypothetical protein